MFYYTLTMDKHHFGAFFKNQVCDTAICKRDAHQVFRFKVKHLHNKTKLNSSLSDVRQLFRLNKIINQPARGRLQSRGHWCWWICLPYVSSLLQSVALLWAALYRHIKPCEINWCSLIHLMFFETFLFRSVTGKYVLYNRLERTAMVEQEACFLSSKGPSPKKDFYGPFCLWHASCFT